MDNTLQSYSEYRASGHRWLGEIPKHWKMERAKWLFRKMERPIRPEDETITCFRDGEVTLRKNRRTEGFTESLKEIGYQGIRKGDLVVHEMDAFAGAVGVSDSDGKSSPVYTVCQPKQNISAEYFAYVIREMARSEYITALATGIRERSTDFRWSTFSIQHFPVPSFPEQRRIAHFLDTYTDRTDRLIHAKERLIELLEEQKQAIIQRAVTRGLDPGVEMKDSGVDWLGEVPAHWKIRKLKHMASFSGGGTPSKDVDSFWKGEIPWVSPKDMKSDYVDDTEDHISSAAIDGSSTNLIEPGSVLIVVRSGILQRKIPVAINTCDVTINQDLKAIEPSRTLTAEYLAAFIRGNQKSLLFAWRKRGATVESIEHRLMANALLPVPPLKEQREILRDVEKRTAKIDQTIQRAQREIALIREYRTRLIADVVTGKLDVREADAAQEAHEVPVDVNTPQTVPAA